MVGQTACVKVRGNFCRLRGTCSSAAIGSARCPEPDHPQRLVRMVSIDPGIEYCADRDLATALCDDRV
jgi:hypothetical protein